MTGVFIKRGNVDTGVYREKTMERHQEKAAIY